MEIKRNFVKGVMNKSLDDRLLPDGFYRDALNIKVSSTDGNDAGTVQNYLGNTEKLNIDTLLTAEGLSTTNILPIGSYTETQNNNIYWFLTSDDYDMVAKYHEDDDGTVTGSLVLIDDKTTPQMNFNSDYLITGVNLVEDLLFFTDGLNPPRRISVSKKYRNISGASGNNISDDNINVIVKPPLDSPVITLVDEVGETSKSLEDKFIRFAYRYKYKGNEISALSPFSKTAFEAQDFSLDFGTGENEGMRNSINAVQIAVDLGSEEVEKVEIVMKDSRNKNVNIVTSINRKDFISKGQTHTYTFRNNKVYTILPDAQVNRLFDNVPLSAKSQEIIGRRIVYGNYKQFFDLKNVNNQKITPDFSLRAVNESIASGSPSETFKSGRDYEVGISYLDDFGRMTTVLESEVSKDTVNIPIANANDKNTLKVTINNRPPSFATKYRLFLKQNKGRYYNIIPIGVVRDGLFIYLLIAKYDIDKVKEGDYIYIKSALSGITSDDKKYKVLEAENKEKDFIADQSQQVQDAGFYIKLKVEDTSYFSEDNLYTIRDTIRSVNFRKEEGDGFANAPISGGAIGWVVEKPIFYGKGDNQSLTAHYSNIGLGTNKKYSFPSDRRFILEITDTNKFSFRDYALTQNYGTDITMNSDNLPDLFGDGPSATNNGNQITVNLGGTDYVFAYIKWDTSKDYRVGDRFVLNYRGNSRGPFGVPVIFSKDNKKYWSGPYVCFPDRGAFIDDNEGDLAITVGTVIEIEISEESTGPQGVQKFISQGNYENIEEWFFEDRIYQKFYSKMPNGEKDGPKAVFFRRGFVKRTERKGRPFCTLFQDEEGYIVMFIKGYEGSTNSERKEISVNIKIQVPKNLAILETEGEPLVDDVYYETPKTYPILNAGTSSAFHGKLLSTDVDQTPLRSAEVTIEDFNAISFGNGLESSVIEDNWNGPEIMPSPRASAPIDRYEQIQAENSLTYSGVFNESSSTNNLNEFNLSLANFKALEQEYGPINKLYSRDTDLIVFQEDKVSKVLFGKNLLSDSVGGGSITSIPQVLGTQVAYTAEFGISNNPESFAKWGNDIFFTDQKRGAVLNLTQSGIKQISTYGMRSYFRDLFDDNPSTQKLGAFDPYEFKYVLSNNNRSVIPCEFEVSPDTIFIDDTEQFNSFLFSIKSNADWSISDDAAWLTLSPSSGHGNADIVGDVTENTTGSERTATITITYCDGQTKTVSLTQTVSGPKQVRIFVKGDKANDGPKETYPEYDYGDGDVGLGGDPLDLGGDYVLFGKKIGFPGTNNVPNSGDSVDIKGSVNFGSATNPEKAFNPNLGNKMYYLDTDTLYETNEGDDLVAASSEVPSYVLDGSKYKGTFTYNATNEYLYMVIDYTNILDHGDSVTSIPVPTNGLPENINIDNSSSIGEYTITYSSTSTNVRFTVENSAGAIIADSGYVSTPSSDTLNVKKTTTGQHVVRVYNDSTGDFDLSIGAISLTSFSLGTDGYDEPGNTGDTADTTACADTSASQTLYHNGNASDPIVGDNIYTTSSGGTLFNGDDKYYKLSTYSIRISDSGLVTDKIVCACGETAIPVISQDDISIEENTPMSLSVIASNNPSSYSVAGNCKEYEFFGGDSGAVFQGDDCTTGITKQFFVSSNQTVNFCYFVGTVSKVGGSSNATFTELGGCSELLPEGIEFDSETGTISGTPTEPGDFDITVTATNCFGTSSETTFTITVKPERAPNPEFQMDTTNPQTSSANACAIGSPSYSTMYHNGILEYPVIYDMVFSDPEGLNLYNGNNQWFLTESGVAILVDADGIVNDTFLCGITTPTPPTYSSVSLAYGADASAACSNTTFTTYYYDGTLGVNPGNLYDDAAGTTPAAAGNYKYDTGGGFIQFPWDGTSWSAPVDCP